MIPDVSAVALCDGLANGRWTSLELTEHFLARIAADRTLHAVCTPEVDRARRRAAASDARRAAGAPLGRLDGLPMTLKDAMRVAGSRTTYGMWLYRGYVPASSSGAAAMLEAAGVVLLGRTTVPTGSFDWNGKNQVHPECVNPHDATRSPGGSSAGAAAAVAAGLSPLDVGSDLGGSIRVPCHFCGVAGLRTTDGWIPVADAAPEGLPVGYEHLVTFGPIARNVADLALVLDVWAAAAPRAEVELAGGPVAISWQLGGLQPDSATRHAIERWLARFPEVVEAEPEVDLADCLRDWGTISGFEFARGMPWYARSRPIRWGYGKVAVEGRLGPGGFTSVFRAGMLASAADYAAAMARREGVHVAMAEFFARHSVWVLPVCPGPALRLSDSGRAVDGVRYVDWIGTWNAPTALMGTPALALPLATTGLPIGVQVHGPRFSDRALVRRFTEERTEPSPWLAPAPQPPGGGTRPAR